MAHYRKRIIECVNCGVVFTAKSNNQTRCPRCQKMVNRRRDMANSVADRKSYNGNVSCADIKDVTDITSPVTIHRLTERSRNNRIDNDSWGELSMYKDIPFGPLKF